MMPDDALSHRCSRRMARREFLGHAATLGLSAGAANGFLSASAAGASADTTSKRELVVFQATDLTALDPHRSTYSSDKRVAMNVFDTLVRRHPDGTMHP